jgi:hypothetical protein
MILHFDLSFVNFVNEILHFVVVIYRHFVDAIDLKDFVILHFDLSFVNFVNEILHFVVVIFHFHSFKRVKETIGK